MALDQNTRPKVFVKFGTRSNAIFGTRSKVLKAKNTIIKTFDLVAKVVRTYLAVDRMHY
jgi:hypothetical protein